MPPLIESMPSNIRCIWPVFFFIFSWIGGVTIFCGLFTYLTYFLLTKDHSNGSFGSQWEYFMIGLVVLYFSYQRLFGHPEEWHSLRQLLLKEMKEYPYFESAETIFDHETQETELKASDKLLFSFHPHGVCSLGVIVNGFCSPHFKKSKTKFLIAENLFWFPLVRDVIRWLGHGDVTRDTFHRLMRVSHNIAFIPGGFHEATLYAKGEHRVYIKNRYGFIKLALQYGYKVYPVYTFGEEETYRAFPYLLKARLFLNEFRIPAVVSFGQWWCGILPLSNTKLITVVGKPIQLPIVKEPTKDQVKKYHDLYKEALQDLFDRYKVKYAKDPKATLQMY